MVRAITLILILVIGAFIVSQFDWDSASSPRASSPSASTPPLAARLTVEVRRTRINSVYLPEANVRVSNPTTLYVDAHVQCSFFDAAGVLVADGMGSVRTIPPGGGADGTVTSADQYARFARTECRVESAWPSR